MALIGSFKQTLVCIKTCGKAEKCEGSNHWQMDASLGSTHTKEMHRSWMHHTPGRSWLPYRQCAGV